MKRVSESSRSTIRRAVGGAIELAATTAPRESPHPVAPIEIDALVEPLLVLDAAKDRYHVTERLGLGGMGEVSAALDGKIGREVALKTLIRQAPAAMAQVQARFIREARIQALLEHPAIVPIYDMGIGPDGLPYFTMKRVRGETLHDVISELSHGKRATLRRTGRHRLLSAFLTVCLAVEYAHERGVVHRDLKPENLMLGPHGEVYILDWGLAKMVGVGRDASRQSSDSTNPGDMVGTPGFMPPEQVLGQHDEVDQRSDVYALGAILFEILTLRPLHDGPDIISVIESTLNPARKPGEPPVGVPPELWSLAHAATRFHKDQRPPSVRALADSIERYMDGDRDQEQRAKLAAERTVEAQRELDRALTGPVDDRPIALARAMHHAGGALALAPNNEAAASVVLRLLAHPPEKLPPEVQLEFDTLQTEHVKVGMRDNALRMATWLVLVPLGLLMGVVRPGYVAAMVALVVAVSALANIAWRRGLLSRSIRMTLLLGSTLLFTLMSGVFGPFLVVPAVAAMNTVLFSALAPKSERSLIIAVGLVPFLLPLMLELCGLVPASFEFAEGAITLMPRVLSFTPGSTFVFLAITSVFSVVLPTLLSGRLRDALQAAERRTLVQKWQFQQMTPAGRRRS